MANKKTWSKKDITQFKTLCGIAATRREVAAVMGVDPKTLNRLIDENLREEIAPGSEKPVTFTDAYEWYSAAGKASLRRRQFEVAMSGNPTMLIYLGKTVLGQQEDAGQPARAKEVTPLDDIRARRADAGTAPAD